MKSIKLIEPTIEYEEDIWPFRQEILGSDDKDKFAGCCTYNSRIKLSNREFNCEYCEVSIDRDFNVATNLYNYLIEKIGRVTAEFTLADLTALENDLNVNDLATSKVETRNQYNFYSYL